MRGEGQQGNEGPCISKEDLREVQGHQPPWGGSSDLRKRKAQAAPGLARAWQGAETPGGEIREQEIRDQQSRLCLTGLISDP